MAPQNFVFGLAGKEDLNIGGGTFTVTLPDGSTVTNYHQIGSHTFLDGIRNAIENGAVGDGTTDDRGALNTLANTTLQPAGGTIYFASPYTYRISSDLTFPANVTLWFAQGAALSVDSGKTVTVLGQVVGSNVGSLFTGTGTVNSLGYNGFISAKQAPFNAVGDGVADDSGAINRAIAFCVANGRALLIPAGRYKLNSALDTHNTDGLMIFGEGCTVPASGLVFLAPTKGTVLIGNTGVDGFMLDAVGSTGLTLRDMSFSSLGASTPSSHGIVIGTSTRTYPYVDGGGGACNFQNLAFYLPLAIFSMPIYGNNFNNSVLINVWSIGGWGPVLVSANDFGITPPYGTFGIIVQNDGLSFLGCVWSTDGTGPCWYLKTVNTFTAVQNYLVTITNGAGYAGYTYAAVITDCFDFRASLEIDYYPAAFHLGGAITQMTLEGLLYNNGATIAANVPIIAFLDCTSVKELDCSKFLPIMGATPNSNFHYTSTGGATPTITQIQGFKGYFDTAISPNIAFLNATAASTAPFKNCEFNGNTDAPTSTAITFEVNGVFASHDKFQNIFVNGWPIRADIPALINGATPSVKYGQGPDRNFLTGGTTTITNFTDGFTGLKITILAEHTITITDGTNIFLNGSASFTMHSTDSLVLIQKADGKWYEIGRSDNT